MLAVGRLRRVPGLVRVLGVLTLLIGVAVMHAVVFSTGHAMAAEPAVSPAAVAPAMTGPAPIALATQSISPNRHGNHSVPGTVPAGAITDRSMAAPMRPTPAVADGSDCDGCTTHAGMHACVFVLVTLALALGLAVIAWLGADRILGAGHLARAGLRRRTRPPPWTVLSLADLAILRI
ncbi:DUF6153 family protein [Nocardia violaceofusca]|uniref:DUF6153 family protein n=1 Tax=Nocardia violaceofusca TaxID=941182 RepID=UPI0012F4E8E7|nr:DUF6153 family protein [Nocardia violaceofusca]